MATRITLIFSLLFLIGAGPINNHKNPSLDKEFRNVYKDIGSKPSSSSSKLVKGWIYFDGTGTISIIDSFNVTSITDNGTGDYTITWDQDFSGDDYATVASAQWILSATIDATAQSAGAVQIAVFDLSNSGAKADSPRVCVISIGDQ